MPNAWLPSSSSATSPGTGHARVAGALGAVRRGGGAGVDLSRSTSLPIFTEYRVFFSRDQFSGLIFGVHF